MKDYFSFEGPFLICCQYTLKLNLGIRLKHNRWIHNVT